jgi:hypothetical protein
LCALELMVWVAMRRRTYSRIPRRRGYVTSLYLVEGVGEVRSATRCWAGLLYQEYKLAGGLRFA